MNDRVKDELRSAQFVRDAVSVMTPSLAARFSLSEEDAASVARDLVHDICAELGGQSIYVGRDMYFGLSERDREIFSLHHGRNTQQLAKQYGLTETRIRQIARTVLLEERSKRQPVLPGLDAQ